MATTGSRKPAEDAAEVLVGPGRLGRRGGGPPRDVPRGHFAVYVGARRSRYVVPLACLGAPQFQDLLRKAEEEFGFAHGGGITLPCDEPTFHAALAAAVRWAPLNN